MPVLDDITVPDPLFISGRLMAAYAIPDVGTLHLHAGRRDHEGRIVFLYVIENAEGVELETGDDLRSGVHAEVDYIDTMETLLAFLTASAEASEYGSEDGSSFGEGATAWAVEFSDELAMAREMINTNPGDHSSECLGCTGDRPKPHLPRV